MRKFKNIFSKLIGAATLSFAAFMCFSMATYADGKITIAVESAYIRANASTSGTVVGGALKGETLDVLSTEKDDSGYEWYKVQVSEGVTGYIRADLVTTSGVTADTPQETPAETPAEAPQAGAEDTVAIDAEPVGGSVKSDVRVRAGASTNHSVVASAATNTAVTVDGYAAEADGNVWYRVTFKDGDKDVTGFIRSDFINLDGELVDKIIEPVQPEPQPEVQPEPEPEPVYKDYEAQYSPDEDTWYLNDYIEGTRNSIPELLEGKTKLEKQEKQYKAQLKKKNIIIGILIFIIIGVVGLSVYGYFYLRGWYTGPEDDTEEPVRSRKSQEPQETPVRSTATSNVRMQTVGANATATRKTEPEVKPQVKQSALTGEKLPDGSVRMPDGSIRRVRRAVKLPDGSLKFEDGSIQRPDGTIVKPASDDVKPYVGSSSQEVRKVSYTHTSETSNDDDMEYGFLNMKTDIDEE